MLSHLLLWQKIYYDECQLTDQMANIYDILAVYDRNMI